MERVKLVVNCERSPVVSTRRPIKHLVVATGPLQTAIIIVYILLMVTKTLHSTENMDKLVSVSTNQYSMVTPTTPKQKLNLTMLQQIDAVNRIYTQIRLARRHIKRRSTVIKEFYSKVKSVLKGVFVYEWLPKEHLQWFESKVRHFDKHKKVSILVPVLYDSLKTFLSTFEEMKKFDAEDQHVVQASVYKKRKKILESIVACLNLAFIEVESGMYIFGLSIEASANLTRVEKGNNWDPKPDHTFVMVQDWGVITTYYKFLKDWVQITKYIYEDFCDATNPKHKCHKHLNMSSSVT